MRLVPARHVGRLGRSLASVLCSLAVAMQIVLPVVHAGHDREAAGAGQAAGVELRLPVHQASTASRHDAATCPECRLVSELRTLSPLAIAVTVPALREHWVVASQSASTRAQTSRTSAAPRAPPLPA
jgi:hypothetical protein